MPRSDLEVRDSSCFLAENGLEWGRVGSEGLNAQKPLRDTGEREWQLELGRWLWS